MNGNWFPWSEQVNGNKPGEYVAAWRHVHDIFTSVGATNATWVWCPYAEVKRRFASLAPLYPGSAYVDWTCMDGFNWASNPTNPHRWRSFGEIFSATYRRLVKQIAPGKPIMLAEMASTGGPRAKAAWIADMFRQLAAKYRQIRGLVWFDQVDRGINWPLESSPEATRAFARGIGDPGFQANVAGICGAARSRHRVDRSRSGYPVGIEPPAHPARRKSRSKAQRDGFTRRRGTGTRHDCSNPAQTLMVSSRALVALPGASRLPVLSPAASARAQRRRPPRRRSTGARRSATS